MAKKRGGGGGSNLTLIMTLVFFILATVILGVTTYLGYSDVERAEKEKKESQKKAQDLENEANWYRFQARTYREYMGQSMLTKDDDKRTLANEFGQFKSKTLRFANNAPGLADYEAFVTNVEKRGVSWKPPALAPSVTYESLLQDKDRQYAALAKAKEQVEKDKNDAEDRVKKLDKDLSVAKETFNKQVAAIKEAADKDRDAFKKEVDDLRVLLKKANEDKQKELLARADAEKARDTFKTQATQTATKLTATQRELKDTRDERDRTKDELRVAIEKSGGDPKALEAATLDKPALDALKRWKKDWRIVELDKKGTMPYINLGSADGLKPQTTFSIHSLGLNGQLNLTPKGTLEVVRVIGPHLARARVTSIRDSKADPIVKGDRLFNPTWDPHRRKHVAIAGLADLGGEGIDSAEDFRRLLARQNVDVDAYIDTRGKEPVLKGDVTSKTDYLVLGETLEAVKHDKVGTKEFRDRFEKLRRDLETKARNAGVAVISLGRYLDMIGYQPPKVVNSNPEARVGKYR
jgi:hypothetical protein